jgi:sortase A
MKKGRIIKLLSIALILVGFILILLPQINSLIISNRTEKNLEMVTEMPAEDLQSNLNKESSFDFELIDEISASGLAQSSGSIDPSLHVGRLLIPSIDLNLPVYNGVTNDILNAGVGTMRPGLTMGEGNFPIAGHYAHIDNMLFADLTSIQIGDEIVLTDNEHAYKYQVYETRIVEPTEVHWIEDAVAEEHGKPVISLMNCYYVNGQNTDDRYFVFGELVDVSPVSESSPS